MLLLLSVLTVYVCHPTVCRMSFNCDHSNAPRKKKPREQKEPFAQVLTPFCTPTSSFSSSVFRSPTIGQKRYFVMVKKTTKCSLYAYRASHEKAKTPPHLTNSPVKCLSSRPFFVFEIPARLGSGIRSIRNIFRPEIGLIIVELV